MNARPIPNNKAHRKVYENGRAARLAGKARFAPYEAGNRSSADFRRAWLAGYDEAVPSAHQAVEALVDAMRRSDPDRAGDHPCTDDEWDAALAMGEAYLAATAAAPPKDGAASP